MNAIVKDSKAKANMFKGTIIEQVIAYHGEDNDPYKRVVCVITIGKAAETFCHYKLYAGTVCILDTMSLLKVLDRYGSIKPTDVHALTSPIKDIDSDMPDLQPTPVVHTT